MSIRKIKIIPKNLFDLSAILEDLNITEVIVNLEGTKEQVKYLCSSPLIEDWNFVDDDNIVRPVLKEKDDTEFNKDDYESLSYFLEKTFRIFKESPSIGFRSTLFQSKFEKISDSNLIDHALITMILQTNYTKSELDWKEIENDFFEKLEKSWKSKSINSCATLSEYIKQLYYD